VPQVINHPDYGPMLVPDYAPADPNDYAIAEQRAQAEAKAKADAEDRAQVQADLDAQTAGQNLAVPGDAAPAGNAPAIQPDVTTGPSPTSGSSTTRTSTSESGSVSQSGPVDAGQPSGLVDPFTGQPDIAGPPPPPVASTDAGPSPSTSTTTFAAPDKYTIDTPDGTPRDGERLVDSLDDGRFGDTPGEQQASADAGLDIKESQLRAAFNEEYLRDPSTMTDQQKLDSQSRLAGYQAQLGDIATQRAADAAVQTAAAQAKVKADAEERQRIADHDAAVKQQTIDSEHKWRMDKLDAADEEAAKKPIDRSWGNGSTGNLVMTAISVALAGLGSAMKGDGAHNPALDIVMQQIDQRVADQYKARGDAAGRREKQRGRLDVYQNEQTLSVKHQQDAMRAHLLKQTADELDQVGATLPASKKAAAASASQAMRDKAMTIRKGIDHESYLIAAKKVDQEERERHQREMEKTAAAQARAEWKRAVTDSDQLKWEKAKWDDPDVVKKRKADAEYREAEAAAKVRAANNPDAMKEAKLQLAEIRARNAQLERGLRPMTPTLTGEKDANGVPVVKFGEALMMRDGKTPVELIGTDAEKGKVRNLQGSVKQAIELADEIDNLITANGGWNSKIADSDAYKQKIAKLQALALENISTIYNMGVPNGKDDERVEALIGGDPNKFRSLIGVGDPRAGIRAMRDTTERKFYNLLVSKSTFDGTAEDLHIPYNTRSGQEAELATTPAGDLIQQSKERAGVTSDDSYYAWGIKPNVNPEGQDTFDLRGVPSHKAADAFYKAADAALGIGDIDPGQGIAFLKHQLDPVLGEPHSPAYQLAAGLAFENRIDLGIPGFNADYYAKFDRMTPEQARAFIATGAPLEDPTAGRAGSLAEAPAAAARKKRLDRAAKLYVARRMAPASKPVATTASPARQRQYADEPASDEYDPTTDAANEQAEE